MRLVYLTALYPAYIRQFYGRRALLELESFDTQLAALDHDGFAWVGAWPGALAAHGFEVSETLCNVGPLQRTWAWEQDRSLLADGDLRPIAVEQVRRAHPEVLFFDHYDQPMLREIKRAVPGLRLTIGWVGGTPPDTSMLGDFDLVLSCAPESIDWLRAQGLPAGHLQHGFNDAMLGGLRQGPKQTDLAFFGQIVTASSFHGARERFLEQLIDAGMPLEVYSPSYEYSRGDELAAAARVGAWTCVRTLKALRVPDAAIRRIPLVRRALYWNERPAMPVSAKLKPRMREGKFGLEMLNAIAATKVTLNVHADASIRFASNMRLFESAGAGGCLLTDWKENLPKLFEPDKEIVTYRSIEDCIEKIKWLIARPSECEAIGRAAQQRALRDHTYKHRAEELAEIVRSALSKRDRTFV